MQLPDTVLFVPVICPTGYQVDLGFLSKTENVLLSMIMDK